MQGQISIPVKEAGPVLLFRFLTTKIRLLSLSVSEQETWPLCCFFSDEGRALFLPVLVKEAWRLRLSISMNRRGLCARQS